MKIFLLSALLLTSIGALSQTTVFSENFESGTLSSFTAGGVQNTLTWQTTTNRGLDAGHSATNSAYFGNPVSFNYNTGSAESAYITSTGIALTAHQAYKLSFNYFLETEGYLTTYDQAEVHISTNGVTYTKLFSNGYLIYNSGSWQAVEYDISDYAGSTVYIRISFDTDNFFGNTYEGFYVDDIEVTSLANSTGMATYGSNGSEFVTSVNSALDGGVVVTGGYYGNDQDYYVLHLDQDLNEVNFITGGRSGESDQGYDAFQSILGGYTVSGELYAGPLGNTDQFVSRVGSTVSSNYLRAHGSTEWAYSKQMLELSSGSMLLGGDDDGELYLTMVSAYGYASWTRRIDLNTYERVVDIQEAPNGSIWVLISNGDQYGESRYGIWNISSTGVTNWIRLYDSNGQENPVSLYIDDSGNGYVTGYTSASGAGSYDASLTKFTSYGYIYWTKIYGGSNSDQGGSVCELPDGSLVMTLTTESFGSGGKDLSLIKLTSSGDLMWGKTYGGNQDDRARFVKSVGNGDIIAIGYTDSYGSGSSDVFAIKTDSAGITDGCYRQALYSQGSYSLSVLSQFPNTSGSNSYSTVSMVSASPSLNSGSPVPNIAFSVTDPLCNGDNGAIDLSVTGGAFPYTYQWSTGGTSEDVLSAPAGSHFVQITDAKGCFLVRDTVVSEPTEVTTAITGTNIDCYGDQDGTVDITVTGGTSPYTYAWTNGAPTEDLSGLSGGFYQVTVTDANGCDDVAAISISEPLPVVAAVTGVQNASCFEECNGQLTVSASGGTSPISYQWNDANSQTTVTAMGLCAGNYVVTATDINGCSTLASAVITEPTELSISVSSNDAECMQSNGYGSASASGGAGSYVYFWYDNGGLLSIGSSISGLNPGSAYSVHVSDANGCADTADFAIGTYVQEQPICVVTVNDDNNNLLVWEKPVQSGIKGFNVYRDVSGTYIPIGYVPYDSLSQFEDLNPSVNPEVTSYRYKVSMLDSCNNESPLSDFHETMHLTTNEGTGGQINLIWDTYEGFGYTKYRILRDSTGTGSWEVIDSVSNFSFTYTDLTPPSGTVEYVMEVIAPSTCNSTRASHNTTRSNKSQPASGGGSIGIENHDISNLVTLYPNPTNGTFIYELSVPADFDGELNITDASGRVVYKQQVQLQAGINKIYVDLSQAERGMYMVNLRGSDVFATNRLGLIR